MFATFIILIVLVNTSYIISDRFNLADESKELAEARCLAENIAGSINQVYAGGNGHKISIQLPSFLNKNNNYVVKVNSSGVLVDLDGRKGLAYIIPEKISKSSNVLESSTITLLPGNKYEIINKKDDSGNNWIVII
jgi:hypothetical protein